MPNAGCQIQQFGIRHSAIGISHLPMASPWTWRLLRAGTLWLDGGGMFGLVPKVLWSKMVTTDAPNPIPLQTNCLLLERDKLKVIVETSCGDKWNDRERALYSIERRTVVDALREVGI